MGRHPANYLMPRMPIRNRQGFQLQAMRPGALRGISGSFPPLSPCCGQVAYALRTRAPVAGSALLRPAAPRLACVRPAASVHPEPGSNSSLYELLPHLLDSSRVPPPGPAGKLSDTRYLFPLILSNFSVPVSSKTAAKIQLFPHPPKKNFTFFLTKI